MTYQEQTWNFLKSKNLPDKSTAAVMGNIQAESDFDPTQIEQGNGIGFGLCQWSFERRTKLEAYGTDINHQFNFLWSELTGENLSVTGASYEWIDKAGYLNHLDFMSGNGSIEELTSSFCFCWERPNADLAHLDYRQTSANQYYTQFNGTTPGPDPSGLYCKLLYPFTYATHNKISYVQNKFLLLNNLGNVVKIKNEVTNRTYFVNKSSIKMV